MKLDLKKLKLFENILLKIIKDFYDILNLRYLSKYGLYIIFCSFLKPYLFKLIDTVHIFNILSKVKKLVRLLI